MYGTPSIASARAVKICPTGASLKNGLLADCTASEACASTWEGKVPALPKASVCCSGAVSQAASSAAASGWAPEAGTVRKDPPQLPPPPGKTSATFQPSTPPARSSIGPVIQAGQTIVAKPSFWNAESQSAVHCSRPAESSSSTAASSTWV